MAFGRTRRALAACLLSAGAAPLHADPPTVVVPVPGAAVQAVRPADLADDPTGFTTVVEPDAQPDTATVEELLSDQVGVQVRRFGGAGQRSEISIRGSTSRQVVVQLDGVRLNTAQSGAVDLSTLPLSLFERVEISRGGGSVEVGSDAIGGVVNLVTRRPGGKRRSALRLTGGSFDTYEASGWQSGSIGRLEYLTAYDYFRTDGDFEFQRPVIDLGGGVELTFDPPTARRENSRVENHSSLVKLGTELGENVYVSLTNQFFRTSRGQPGLDDGAGEFAGQQLEAHERRWRNVAVASLQAVSPGGRGELEARFHHRYEDTRFADPLPGLGPPIDTRNGNGTFGGDVTLRGRLEMSGFVQEPMIRLDARRDSLHSDEFIDQTRHSGGVLLQGELSWLERRVIVTPAVRWAYESDFSDQLLPRIGVAVTPLPWLRLQASWEESYRVPQFDELFFPDKGFLRGNPGLQPEQGDGWDAGVVVGFAGLGPFRNVRLEAAYFDQDLDDSIVFVTVSPFTVAAVNTGPASLEGWEVSAALDWLGWLRASANHTHLRALRDENGRRLPGRARDETSGRVEVGPPSRWWTVVGEVHRVSPIPVSLSGNRTVSRRTVYDASVSIDLAVAPFVGDRIPLESLVVGVDGRNLGDRSIRDAQFFPQTVRTVMVRVEAGW